MRFVPVNCIREGMVVAKKLVGRNANVLLNSGTVIRSTYIPRIKELGYSGIYIIDDLSEDIETIELINDELRHKTVKGIRDTFISIEKGTGAEPGNVDGIHLLVDEILDGVLSNRELMINMIDLKVFDDYTFAHSTNVGVLSIVIGAVLGLNRTQLFNLGLAALLHDVGKVFVSKTILNKPGALSRDEFDVIKNHPVKGYEYLKNSADISAHSFVGVLQHHEKYDGSGYPSGLKGEQISLFARIIAVTDVFDALTSRRPYRKALSPSEAIEYIMAGGGTMFDPNIVQCFVKRVAPYPAGTCVCLSNMKVGIVTKNYMDCSLRPLVKIIKHGSIDVEPYYVDLKQDIRTRSVIITGFYDEEDAV